MTAHAMEGDRERCIEAGMNDYVTKPIDLKVLRSVLARWTGAQPSRLDELPVFQYVQQDAEFYGLEAEIEFPLYESDAGALHARLGGEEFEP